MRALLGRCSGFGAAGGAGESRAAPPRSEKCSGVRRAARFLGQRPYFRPYQHGAAARRTVGIYCEQFSVATIREQPRGRGERGMNKTRLEAFSDGVIAILITIMVLELKAPHGTDLAALQPLAAGVPELRPQLRHAGHLLEQPSPPAARGHARQRRRALGEPAPAVLAVAGPVRHRLDGREPLRAPLPTAAYGIVLLLAASPTRSWSASAGLSAGGVGTGHRSDGKGNVSLALYAIAIPLTVVAEWLAIGLFALVALIWLVPDTRIEGRVRTPSQPRAAHDAD